MRNLCALCVIKIKGVALLKESLKIAFRQLKSQKLHSAVNIIGLALGICITVMIFMWGRYEFSFDDFYPENHKAYFLYKKQSPGEFGQFGINYLVGPRLKERFHDVADFTRMVNQSNFQASFFSAISPANPNQRNSFYETDFFVADTGFFKVIPFEFIYGTPEYAFKYPNSVILKEEISRKYFGNINPVGLTLTHNNTTDLIVTGVVDIPENSTVSFDVLASMRQFREDRMDTWDVDGPSIILLRNGANESQFRKSIKGFFTELAQDENLQTYLDILPLDEMHLHFGVRAGIITFMIIGVMILVLACLNFINLSIASGLTRYKEIMVRKVTGASRAQIIRQFILESFLTVILAIMLALIMTELLTPAFNKLVQRHLAFFHQDQLGINLLLIIFITIFTTLVSGLYPALYFSGKQPIKILKGSDPSGSGKNRFRKASLVFQYIVTIFLLVSTIIYSKQIMYIENMDLGLNYDNVIRLPITDEIRNNFNAWCADLKLHPNIQSVTAASTYPTGIGNNSNVSWTGAEQNSQSIEFSFAMIQTGYFETFDMKIADGRSLSEDIKSDMQGYIINQDGADLIAPGASAVGKTIKFWGHEGQVIGVVKNFHDTALYNKIGPLILCPFPDYHFFMKHIFIKLKPGNYDATLKFIQEKYERYSPNTPFEYQFADVVSARDYDIVRLISTITAIATVLTILIASFGLFGLAALSIRKKTKEIGIRKVLGAQTINILVNLNMEFVWLIIIANLIASPLAWFVMKQGLRNFAYQTTIGVGIFILAGLMTIIIAILTVSTHAIRAAIANPVESLRYE